MDLYDLSTQVGNTISVNVTEKKPNKYFKIRACPGGIILTIDTCDNPLRDTFISLWWRDKLDFKLIHCHDNQDSTDDCIRKERIYPGLEYFDEELFVLVSSKTNPTDTIQFKFSVEDVNTLSPGINSPGSTAWPNCIDTVTADYKKGSATANMDTGADPNFSLDFLYSGTMMPHKFRALVFDDQVCQKGKEIGDNEGTSFPHLYSGDPFTVTIDPPSPYSGFISPRVNLKANYQFWDEPLWKQAGEWGTLEFCVQFQVWKTDKAKMEFVDVAMKVVARRTQQCDNPDCYKDIQLIRDKVNSVEKTIKPNTPIYCGHCEEQTVTTVTQGESFNMCVKLKPASEGATLEPGVCIVDILELDFKMRIGTNSYTTFGVIPNLDSSLLTGPQDCRPGTCKCFLSNNLLWLVMGFHHHSQRIFGSSSHLHNLISYQFAPWQ